MTANQLFEFARDRAKDVFNKAGYHAPIFLLVLANDQVIIAPMGTGDDKDTMSATLKAACRQGGVKRIAFICEMWFLEVSKESKTLDMNNLPRPSTSPNRKEGISISVESIVPGERNRVGIYTISRDASGKGRVDKFEESEPDILGVGRFSAILRDAAAGRA